MKDSSISLLSPQKGQKRSAKKTALIVPVGSNFILIPHLAQNSFFISPGEM